MIWKTLTIYIRKCLLCFKTCFATLFLLMYFSHITKITGLVYRGYNEKDNIWLVAPLIAKLHPSIQGRVLKAASQQLENGNNLWPKGPKDKETWKR